VLCAVRMNVHFFLSPGKRLARNVVSMASGEPSAPLADEQLAKFVGALKQEVKHIERLGLTLF
jgi:hypothetical protein